MHIFKSKGQPFVQFWDLTYLSRFTDYVEFLHLGHFLRKYKGLSHETWVMHTSWRVKVNPTFNFETWPTFYGSLTFIEFLRLGHFLRNYKG